MMFCLNCLDVIIRAGRSRWWRRHGGLPLRKGQRNRRTWCFLIPLKRAEEVSGSRHG